MLVYALWLLVWKRSHHVLELRFRPRLTDNLFAVSYSILSILEVFSGCALHILRKQLFNISS
jgi:hypothetical protein